MTIVVKFEKLASLKKFEKVQDIIKFKKFIKFKEVRDPQYIANVI